MDFIEDIESLAQAKSIQEILIDTHERIGMILDQLPIGLLIQQKQGILFANQTASDFLGCSQEALIGQHFLDHLDPVLQKTVSEALSQAFDNEDICKIEKIALTMPGQLRKIYSVVIAKMPWEGTPVVQILIHDITKQATRRRQIENIIATDSLTGAQSRRSFINYVEELRERGDIGDCGIILWDIDFFKNVNDTYGRQLGDTTLRSVVWVCEHILAYRALVDQPDLPHPMLARFGGEEFVIILPDIDIDETLHYAEAIRRDISNHVIKSEDAEFSVTVSLGVVMGDIAMDDIDMLINLADKALYAAKENGRDQVVHAEASMSLPPEGRRVSRMTKRQLH